MVSLVNVWFTNIIIYTYIKSIPFIYRFLNFSNFFKDSYVDDISVLGESIKFKRIHKDPLTFKIINFGDRYEMHESLKGAIMLESKDISETMYLTKYFGNFNINKIGNQYIFENKSYALILEKANVGF